MKIIQIFYSTLVSLCFLSCSNSTDDLLTSDNSNNDIAAKRWVVSSYKERGTDHTSFFSGYVFDFNENSTLIVAKGSASYTGTWNELTDSGKKKLDLYIAANSYFEEISDDWDIISKSNTLIELQHTSGGDGHQDFLTFKAQ